MGIGQGSVGKTRGPGPGLCLRDKPSRKQSVATLRAAPLMFGRGIQPSVAAATLPMGPMGVGGSPPCPRWPKADQRARVSVFETQSPAVRRAGGGGFHDNPSSRPQPGSLCSAPLGCRGVFGGELRNAWGSLRRTISLSTWLRSGGAGEARAPQSRRKEGPAAWFPLQPGSLRGGRCGGEGAAPGPAGGAGRRWPARGAAGRGGAGGPAGPHPRGKPRLRLHKQKARLAGGLSWRRS